MVFLLLYVFFVAVSGYALQSFYTLAIRIAQHPQSIKRISTAIRARVSWLF